MTGSEIVLSTVRAVTTRFPKVRGFGYFTLKILIPLLRLLPQREFTSKTLGSLMQLNVHENVDSKLLLIPQIFDFEELDFISNNLKEGQTFVDIGGHIGMYACFACNIVGNRGRVLSIEADPTNFGILNTNLELNGYSQGKAVNVGLSDKVEVLKLFINDTGNRSGNTFLNTFQDRKSIEIAMRPLHNVLLDNSLERIDMLKIDIEGYEFKVMREFFKTAAVGLWPKYIITEYHESNDMAAGGSIIRLLKENSYETVWKNGLNYVLERIDS